MVIKSTWISAVYIFTFITKYWGFQLDQFVVDDLQPIMVTDAGAASHPIIVDVRNPDQINEVFDGISYSKVSSYNVYTNSKSFKRLACRIKYSANE